ncbi:MAG: prepilin-type N-terminal cleavage/methylation domain-containing protein, partial [Candidatus Omnitrophica bacterium]|nr:prepilin-type N-terminal cleavage/methylation domain-containing protein [Candidatus Omnitrophota bacterium]
MMKLQVRGFTLSELMIAAAILVLVLSALLVLYINCMILNEASRNLSIATSHAQYMMEEIK